MIEYLTSSGWMGVFEWTIRLEGIRIVELGGNSITMPKF